MKDFIIFYYNFIFCFAFFLVLISGCNSGTDSENKNAKAIAAAARADSIGRVKIKQALEQVITPQQFVWTGFSNKAADSIKAAVAQFYTKRDFQWAWIGKDEINQQGSALLKTIANAAAEGLNPNRYGLQKIDSLRKTATDTAKLSQLDAALTLSYMAYASDQLTGQFKPKGLWDISPRKQNLADNLTAALTTSGNNFETALANLSPQHPQYPLLKKQLALYLQAPSADTTENSINAIKLSMERLRWLPESLGERHVWVNIPEFLIRVVDKGDTVSTIRACVGEPKHATPILVNKPMTNAIFSPVWNIPTNIAKEEMEFILMNPAVIVVADVDVWLDGQKVNPLDINWHDVDMRRVRMRQRPKETNSMGQAKFPFTNGYNIYLHDTPNKTDFLADYRAVSHGCVRVQQPVEFAQKVLQGSTWDESAIKGAMYKGRETYAKLPEPVKVHVFYLTTWVNENGKLQFGRDVYGYDKRQITQLINL